MLINSRRIAVSAAVVFLCLSQLAAAQESAYSSVPVPEALRMPQRGEAPRYPEDLVIGELGQGGAPLGAYQLAQETLSALLRNAPLPQGSSSRIDGSSIEEIRGINARSYRIGGGRYEPDGSVSFIVRFIGRAESITGELFVRFEEPRPPAAIAGTGEETAEDAAPARQESARWLLDDLLLEDKVPLSSIRDEYRYDFSPYERFY